MGSRKMVGWEPYAESGEVSPELAWRVQAEPAALWPLRLEQKPRGQAQRRWLTTCCVVGFKPGAIPRSFFTWRQAPTRHQQGHKKYPVAAPDPAT